MRVRLLALSVLVALAAGVGLGVVTRTPTSDASTRPASVERLLRALDAFERSGDRVALAAAVDALGDRGALAPPWRAEADLAAVVAAGDDEALWRFAVDAAPAPPRARALLRLATAASSPAVRERAAARFLVDYPRSWAAARARAPR